MPALEACATADALAFSPLLTTKTVAAAFLRGWLAAPAGDADTARTWFHTGIAGAERALHRPWDELLLGRLAPSLFGLREATLVVDLASRCAAALLLLPQLAERPGIFAAQVFDSLAERARGAQARSQQLEAELEAARAEVGALRSQADRIRADAQAALLLQNGQPMPSHLRVAIFGAGSGGRRALDALRLRGATIACVTDNDATRHGTMIEGVPIVPPASLPAQAIDLIAVASLPGRAAIFAQLEDLGYRAGLDFACV
jgi:hypothetical protein